jgi:type I restriction enzyme, S subunit
MPMLKNHVFQRILWSKVNATAQPGVFLGELGKLPIPLPQLQEQEAIADLFSNIHLKIENNKMMNKTLEGIGQAIFKRWFVDFEFPNQEGKPNKASGGEMVTSEIGEIPKEWSVGKYSDLKLLSSQVA